MDKMTFANYKFKPGDVIEGLNRYFAENKAYSYLRVPLEIRNGEVKPGNYYVFRNIIFDVSVPKVKELGYFYFICDPEEVVGVAINWLREEHDIFYTPGMKIEDVSRPDDSKDIFDTPRYHFLSILSSELGFRTIVGPGNADKVEEDILRVIKHRNELAKDADDNRREFLRNLRCELGVPKPVVNGCIEEMEYDILERIGKLKEGNWPCENSNTFAEYMKTQFPKECEKWNVVPLQEGSVHDWVQYIFSILDEWRKRAVKAEEELDRAWSYCGKLKGMLNTMYGASCGGDVIDVLPCYRDTDTVVLKKCDAAEGVLPCYRDTCNNPKAIRERDAAKDALAELHAKIREVYREVFSCGMPDHYSYTVALDDILEELKFQKKLKETAEEKTVDYKTELNKCREYILTVYREIFDCSNGDPEGSDKETLEDILTEYRRVVSNFEERTADWYKVKNELSNLDSTLKKKYEDERKLVSSVRAERDSNKARYLVFLDKLAKILDVSYSNPNYIPAKEQDILRAVGTLSENYKATTRVLEESRKDYDELGKAYSSVLKWNNSYADIRRLLGVSADADAGEMVGALNKLVCERETCDRIRKKWHERYLSERTRANGEHKRAEKLNKEVHDWTKRCDSLEQALNAKSNEEVGLDAFKNECRKLRDEKAKVIKALGQDIWDDCVK